MIPFIFMLMLLTFNSNGLHNQQKWPKFWQTIKSNVTDIIAVQETHLTTEQEYAFKLHAQSYEIFFSHGTSQTTGIFLAVRRNHGIHVVHHVAINAHIQFLDVTYNETNYRIINLYAPTAVDRRKQCYAELQCLVIEDY